MKEASGEANLTVVAIILIGVVVAIATPLVRNMMTNTAGRACCTDGGGYVEGGKCIGGTFNGMTISAISNDTKCAQNQAGRGSTTSR